MRGAAVAAICLIMVVAVGISPTAITRGAAVDGAATVIAGYRIRIPELMAQEHIPGLAIAVVDGDGVLWQEGFGVTDTDRQIPVSVETIFSVQSMSKLFTATAVMQAVQAGRLALDVPITTYLPGFTVHSAFEAHPEQKITLRMLLSHTAGFTHEAPLGNNYESDPGDFDAHVRSISDTWLRFPVGTGYAYSNLGIDLAGYILEQVGNTPFPDLMRESLLAPLTMDHSTFDRALIHTTTDRAVGHSGGLLSSPLDVPMVAAGGLWSSAADLATFLRFQLGDGTIDGKTLLDASLMDEMRTVPAPDADAPAGYALGVARTHWRAGRYLDLFSHGGAGYGFLSDLWWLPQLQLGVAVLFNSSDHDLQGALALGVLRDLVNEPGSVYHDRILALPVQPDVIEPDGHWVAPADLAERIGHLAMPTSNEQAERWGQYLGAYRTGKLGEMDAAAPPSRFLVVSGMPYFDAAEDGTGVRHQLTEFQPGLFLTTDGQTLDLRGPHLSWRGIDLTRVTGGPLAWQWALLALVGIIAVWWFGGGALGIVRRGARARRHPAGQGGADVQPNGERAWRRATISVAVLASGLALTTIAAIVVLPGIVDVGFLGGMALLPMGIRVALHLPLAVALSAGCFMVLIGVRWARGWWTPQTRPRDVALAMGLTALAIQLGAWHLVAWGLT